MKEYFNIRYEFDHASVLDRIDRRVNEGTPGYICVADGVILNTVNSDESYRQVIDGSMFSICDSSYVPLYIRWIYGEKYCQYAGSEIFNDIVSSCKYRMAFLGCDKVTLDGLRRTLAKINPDVNSMLFYELPFKPVGEFDYPSIAKMVADDGADIVWVALGAPKQEIFMSLLQPHMEHGVMIAVGAAFKFYSGVEVKRAPSWMVRCHLEFVHRIMCEPRKQIRRCSKIVVSLPGLLYREWNVKRQNLSETAF